MRRLHHVAQNALIVIGSLSVCVLALEAGIRAFSTWVVPRMMVLDDRLGWRHAGHVRKAFTNEDGETFIVAQNRFGHRGREYPLQRTAGKYRILILGDSFTEGVHVAEDDLFSARLERANPQLEVLNAGVGGYGTVQEYVYFVSEGVRFKPDLLVLMFFDNDLSDNCLSYYAGFGPRPYARIRQGEVEIVERLESADFLRFTMPVPFRSALSRHSYLYYFLNTHVYQRLFARRMRELQKADVGKTLHCGRYEILSRLVTRMHDTMKAGGGDFAMVLIPTAEEVSRGSSKTQEPIVRFCEARALRCLQLLSRFARERASGARVYFDADIHWTRVGHDIAAAEIGDFLSEIIASARTREGLRSSSLRSPDGQTRRW
jgi:GDSL-like Lipase/Acylhydrolase family